jgi:hypothetical protein
MRSNVYKSSIDAFLLTVDFSKLDEAWFAQFDQGGALSEEIQGLLKQCITDYQNFKQSINNPLAEIDPQNVLQDIKSRIKSHKQQFDAVVSGGKEINFETGGKDQLMMGSQQNTYMLNHNVLCYQLFLNSSLEQGRKNAFFKLIDNPSTLAALFSKKDLTHDQKTVAFGLLEAGQLGLKTRGIFGNDILSNVKKLIFSYPEFLIIWQLLNDGTDGMSIFSADLSAEIKKVFAQSIRKLDDVVTLLLDKKIPESDRKVILANVDVNRLGANNENRILKMLLLNSKQIQGNGSQPNIGFGLLLEILQSYETSKNEGFGAMLKSVSKELEKDTNFSSLEAGADVRGLRMLNSRLISQAPIGFNRDGLRTLIEKCKRMYQGASYGGGTLEQQAAKLNELAKLINAPIMKSDQGELTKPISSHTVSVPSNSLSAAPNTSTAQRTAKQPLHEPVHRANIGNRP